MMDSSDWLMDRGYSDRKCQFRFVIAADSLVATARLSGRATMNGVRAFMTAMEDASDALPSGRRVVALADLSALEGTPFRAQLMLGKWLLQHRHQVGRVAIFGARPWEMKLAKAVFKIAGIRTLSFFRTRDEAVAWLETPVEGIPVLTPA